MTSTTLADTRTAAAVFTWLVPVQAFLFIARFAVLDINIKGQSRALQNVIMLSKLANKAPSFLRSTMKAAVGAGIASGLGGALGIEYFRSMFKY